MKLINQKSLELFQTRIQDIKKKKGPLLPALHLAQEMFGHIPISVQQIIEIELNISNSHISSVVSFYELFSEVPTGEHLIGICSGTSCHIQKSHHLLQYLQDSLGIKKGETTKDGLFTIVPVKCLGHCDTSPNLLIDSIVYTHVTKNKIQKILQEFKK